MTLKSQFIDIVLSHCPNLVMKKHQEMYNALYCHLYSIRLKCQYFLLKIMY